MKTFRTVAVRVLLSRIRPAPPLASALAACGAPPEPPAVTHCRSSGSRPAADDLLDVT